MPLLTPTSSGALVAGAGLGIFSWSVLLKSPSIPLIKKYMTVKRKERVLSWMNRNKGLTLLGLETVNFGIHGITSAESVLFASGNTIWNVLMIFAWLPMRQGRKDKEKVKEVLAGYARH